MFECVNVRRIKTHPISGTIKRGDDAIFNSEHIFKLPNSRKDQYELTMYLDVNRNDKSYVCKLSSVLIIWLLPDRDVLAPDPYGG